MSTRRSVPIDQYQVGVVCALPHEMTAAMAILDERHQQMISQDKLDNNNYVLGRVHDHNVVIACLPAGVYGTNSVARVARDMVRTFTGLRFGLMIGIGGGIPNLQKGLDIRLGDVVVSQPDQTYGGVVQYDLGKNLGDHRFERTGILKPPPTILLTALATLRAEHDLSDSQVPDFMAKMYQQHLNLKKRGYMFPGRESDNLYCSQCSASSSNSCDLCTDGKIERQARENQSPAFWYGVIASGNELVKNAAERDRLSRELGAMCIEMEAAGLMNDFPCIVIRGICDYADSHKNKVWQKYAALTAAAYAKEFLLQISPDQTSHESPIHNLLDSLNKQSRLTEEHIHEIRQENDKQERRHQSNEARDCHRALKTSTYDQFKDINPNRVEGTCRWVLSHPQYLQWAQKDHDDLLWISADPGCGKSVLTKSLVDKELQATEEHTICYFFFKDNEKQDNLATALCALLHQLFSHQPRLITYAIPAWEKNSNDLIKEVSELWRILLASARDDTGHDVTCVLDALDECRPADRRVLIEMLTNFYTQMFRSQSTTRRGRLKFLVTSRPYPDIQIEFQKVLDDLPTIRLQGEEENDQIHEEINLVIRKRVEEVAKECDIDSLTKDRLEAKLLGMKHRTYLWLYLAIGDIYETFRDSMRPEEASIESLPSTVEDAYEKILSRVSEKQRDNVKKILQIIVGARRPLTVQEMAIFLGVSTSSNPKSLLTAKLDPIRLQNNICHWCGLFIFINHARIYLIHQTAKEFLICDSGFTTFLSGWKHCLDPRGVEKVMTQICVDMLCLDDSPLVGKSLVQRFEKYRGIEEVLDKENDAESVVAYVAEYWAQHFRDADILTSGPIMTRVSRLYDTDSALYRLWFAIFWKSIGEYEDQPQMNPIYLAALLGHGKVLKAMLQSSQRYDVNERDKSGLTALARACKYGHEKVVQMLLDEGADVNTQDGRYGNALLIASSHDHEKVVQILLDKGVDINIEGGFYGNALQAASAEGHEKVVQILVNKGVDVNAQGGYYGNALQAASILGHEKVVQILLNKGADIQGGWYGNALQAASMRGHEKVVQILLDKGVDINIEGGFYGNALQAASEGGHEKVVQILLNKGADINIQGGRYGNALQAASGYGHKKVVQILLNNGADVNTQGGWYGNALRAASECGHEKVVQILLDNGANPDDLE